MVQLFKPVVILLLVFSVLLQLHGEEHILHDRCCIKQLSSSTSQLLLYDHTAVAADATGHVLPQQVLQLAGCCWRLQTSRSLPR